MVIKWTLGGFYGVCERSTKGLRLVCEIGQQEGPKLSLLLEYTLETWVEDSLHPRAAFIYWHFFCQFSVYNC